MNKHHATRQAPEATRKTPATGGRVFKFPFKNIPAVDAKMWKQMEVAARIPRKGRHYPVMIEAPDADPAEI
jgi:hypothetical protein